MSGDTIAAISTGFPGAIGIIRISGEETFNLIEKLFFPKSEINIRNAKPGTQYYGEFRNVSGEAIDLCLAAFMHAPKSYTGEDMAEIYMHCSAALMSEALLLIYSMGARPAEPGEFTKRAFLNGKMDLSEAEAVIDLICAESETAAKNAVKQLRGGVWEKVSKIRMRLIDLVSHFQAAVDFPEEDVEPFLFENANKILKECVLELKKLGATYQRGRFLKEGIPVCLIGRPNTGKSSLLNTLCGKERAIVTKTAGTTRDIISEKIKAGPVVLELLDTAGLRKSGDEIEEIGIKKAIDAAEEAALIIAVFDGSEHINDNDKIVLVNIQNKRAVALINKSDLGIKLDLTDYKNRFEKIFYVSAKTGEGLEEFIKSVPEMFGFRDNTSSEMLMTNIRQSEAVVKAAARCEDALKASEAGFTPDVIMLDAEGAIELLGEVTGDTASDDIINNIFSRF